PVAACHSLIALLKVSAMKTSLAASTATLRGAFSPEEARVVRGLAATYVLPAWVTVRVSPAIVNVPLRVPPGLASKVRLARPLPVPEADVCSHGALDEAVHGPLLLTTTDALPAAGPSNNAVVPRLLPSWVTPTCWPSTVRCAVRLGPVLW